MVNDGRDDAKRARGRSAQRGEITGYEELEDDASAPARNQASIIPDQGSKILNATGGMMRIPATIEESRAMPPPSRSKRSSHGEASHTAPGSEGGEQPSSVRQLISLSRTSVQAMPSSSQDLHVLHERDGGFASAIRLLGTRVDAMRLELNHKSFLVTSVSQGEGKTVVATNLALALSEDAERRVVLVDANFRSPRAGKLFNLEEGRGLLAAISGKQPLSQCIAKVLGRNLIVLHAGGVHQSPASVLGSGKFKSLLAELYEAVDVLIIDAPSALPFADVPVIAQSVDAVLMVIAENRTRRAQLDHAMETIGRHRVSGTIYVRHGVRPREKNE